MSECTREDEKMCQHNSPNFVSLKFKPPDTYFISADRREKLRSSCNFAIICLERCSNFKFIKYYQIIFFLRPPGGSKIRLILSKRIKENVVFCKLT